MIHVNMNDQMASGLATQDAHDQSLAVAEKIPQTDVCKGVMATG